MKKVFFENSIFLHQRVGGISKYISKLNNEIRKTGINSIIYCPLTINTNLKKNKKSDIFYLRFIKIPLFCTKIFYLINNLLTIIYMKLSKPDIFHFTYYNNFLLKFIKMPYVLTVYDLISEKYNYKNTRFKKSELINLKYDDLDKQFKNIYQTELKYTKFIENHKTIAASVPRFFLKEII